MKNDELDSVLDLLKPLIDDFADAAYERRPDPAAIRARAGDRRQIPRRRPLLRRRPVIAAGATATAALTATAVLAGVSLTGGGHDSDPRPPRTTGRTAPIDTRAFLLASAETVAKEPVTSGTCWYSRLRTWQDQIPIKPRPGSPRARGPQRTFQARTASSIEDWKCTLPRGTRMRFRTHGPLDIRLTFPSKKDEAAWRAAGSPALDVNGGWTNSKPFTTTYYRGSHLVNPVIGSHEIEWKTIPDLPATKRGLESHLRKLWRQDRGGGAHGYIAPADFCQYVFVSAWDLFMAPATPGTRASLYRILADCPSIRATEGVSDRLGRPGVALTYGGVRLIIDPKTARLLVFEQLPSDPAADRPAIGEYTAYERQGWVQKIGAIPDQ